MAPWASSFPSRTLTMWIWPTDLPVVEDQDQVSKVLHHLSERRIWFVLQNCGSLSTYPWFLYDYNYSVIKHIPSTHVSPGKVICLSLGTETEAETSSKHSVLPPYIGAACLMKYLYSPFSTFQIFPWCKWQIWQIQNEFCFILLSGNKVSVVSCNGTIICLFLLFQRQFQKLVFFLSFFFYFCFSFFVFSQNFPPWTDKFESSGFLEVFSEVWAKLLCIFGLFIIFEFPVQIYFLSLCFPNSSLIVILCDYLLRISFFRVFLPVIHLFHFKVSGHRTRKKSILWH